MSKKSGAKSSRSERRAGRKRAERAREHGLPTRKSVPALARARTPRLGEVSSSEARSNATPQRGEAKAAGVPTLVWVVGGALAILLGVYLLSQKRDEALTETAATPELAPASVSAQAIPASSAAAEPPLVASSPAGEAAPEPVVPPAQIVTPSEPLVTAPVVSAPAAPKVPRPVVSAPPVPRAPAAVKPPAVPLPAAVPAPVVVPASEAAPAMPAAPAAPADNPG